MNKSQFLECDFFYQQSTNCFLLLFFFEAEENNSTEKRASKAGWDRGGYMLCNFSNFACYLEILNILFFIFIKIA